MIRLDNLTKYFNGKLVLRDINLSVSKGETVAIIGPSGSGKSTLLRCINLLETPTQGSVFIDDRPVTNSNIIEVRKKVSMVFQHFHLFNTMTVLDNITYAPIQVLKLSKTRAQANALELLKIMGLSNKASSYPHSLSGGQKQRVAIVRSLAMNPEAILFDEPTSALDPEMVKEVLTAITSLAHTGITILINTHEMNFAREVADRIVFLDHGEILEEGSPKVFFNTPKTERVKQFLEKVL